MSAVFRRTPTQVEKDFRVPPQEFQLTQLVHSPPAVDIELRQDDVLNEAWCFYASGEYQRKVLQARGAFLGAGQTRHRYG